MVCHNPDAAARDAGVRERLIEHLQGLIEGSDTWPKTKRDELVGSLKNKPGLRRLLRRTRAGLLRIDRAAVEREAHYDGKWLLRTSDPTLTAEDLAAAYKQLIAVERGWRDCKTSAATPPRRQLALRDEVFVKINGTTHYLWCAVDQHGNVLDILVQSGRNAVAAKRFFRKLLKGLR